MLQDPANVLQEEVHRPVKLYVCDHVADKRRPAVYLLVQTHQSHVVFTVYRLLSRNKIVTTMYGNVFELYLRVIHL